MMTQCIKDLEITEKHEETKKDPEEQTKIKMDLGWYGWYEDSFYKGKSDE